MIVLELRVPVGAATFRRQIQHQPKRVEVWGTARILSGVGHRTAHLTTVEVVNRSVTPGENTEAWYVGVGGIDVGACVIAEHVGDKREVREPAVFLYSTSRSMGERAVTAIADRSRRLTAMPFQELKNDVHMGHGVLRSGPYIML